jgi:hypothetical protein
MFHKHEDGKGIIFVSSLVEAERFQRHFAERNRVAIIKKDDTLPPGQQLSVEVSTVCNYQHPLRGLDCQKPVDHSDDHCAINEYGHEVRWVS